MSQTLRALGLRPVGANYDTVRRRIEHLGLDTAHWGRLSHITVDEAVLRRAVESSRSVAECLRVLGWPQAGSRRARLHAFVRVYGLETSHFVGQRANAGRRFPQFVRPLDRYLVLGARR